LYQSSACLSLSFKSSIWFCSTASCEVLYCCCFDHLSFSISSWPLSFLYCCYLRLEKTLNVLKILCVNERVSRCICVRVIRIYGVGEQCRESGQCINCWFLKKLGWCDKCHAYNWHSRLIWQITWHQTLWLHLTVVCPWWQQVTHRVHIQVVQVHQAVYVELYPVTNGQTRCGRVLMANRGWCQNKQGSMGSYYCMREALNKPKPLPYRCR